MDTWLVVSITAVTCLALHFILDHYHVKRTQLSQIATLTAEKQRLEREASYQDEKYRRLQDENLQLHVDNLSLQKEKLLHEREIREARSENQKLKEKNDQREEDVRRLTQERDASKNVLLQGKSIEYVVWFLSLLLRLAGMMGISRPL